MLIVTFKKYFSIGYVNKLMGDYRQVFCLIYSSHIAVLFMVRIYGNSILLVLINAANPGIKTVRKLLHIPFNTHVWIFGPLLIKQNNLRVQLKFRNFQFLLNAFNSINDIVKTCIHSAMYYSNTSLDINLPSILINIL